MAKFNKSKRVKSAKKNVATKITDKWSQAKREARRSITEIRSVIKSERVINAAGIALSSEFIKALKVAGEQFKDGMPEDMVQGVKQQTLNVREMKARMLELNALDARLNNMPVPKALVGQKLEDFNLDLLDILAEVSTAATNTHALFVDHSTVVEDLFVKLQEYCQLSDEEKEHIAKVLKDTVAVREKVNGTKED